ncbi:MAG: hypothetical protein EHM35_20740, partial [Planctomycetaceae bacterium]
MHRIVIAGVIVGLSFIAGPLYGQTCSASSTTCQVQPQQQEQQPPADSPLETILEGLQKKASELKSYECKVDYLVNQTLLESKTRRTGVLYYARFDGRSRLRVDFLTLQQDEEPQQEYREQITFDGVWLQQISYQTRS